MRWYLLALAVLVAAGAAFTERRGIQFVAGLWCGWASFMVAYWNLLLR